MEITGSEAREALQDIDSVGKSVRGKLVYGKTGGILILWGVIWMACFAIAHFAPAIASWAWLAGDSLGIVGSIYLGRGETGAVVRSGSAKRIGMKLFWFWLLLFVYGDIWLAVLWPWRGEQMGLFVVTLAMFGYVVMGLWLEMWFMLWLGLVVTALAGAGYLLCMRVPGYLDLNLWFGLVGGSALVVSGWYLKRRWR